MTDYDVIVIGSGPNGLAAAVYLADQGAKVLVVEGDTQPGGGMRTAELTEPGFLHDVCSAVHTTGVVSPYLSKLPLDQHGLEWIFPEASVAHPLDDSEAVLLERSIEATCANLGEDGSRYRRLIAPFLRGKPEKLVSDLLGPLRLLPSQPLKMARFGWLGMRAAASLARGKFRGERARALFAGCAAHSIIPLERLPSAAVGLVFSFLGHVKDWPVARGGSASIAKALVSLLKEKGGDVQTGTWVKSMGDLPSHRVVLFDTSPKTMVQIAGDALPERYVRRLAKFRYGPGVFKIDYALEGPIPWRDPRCLRASTVHVGGTLDEIAASERAVFGADARSSERPFVMVCQQSQFDASRAPAGKHTGYAYCHVPENSDADMTEFIENQIERFAPGFRKIVSARASMTARQFESHNPNYVGGAITGGVADLWQLFTRPVARLNPYTTPNRKIMMCSASTPPGGGVHGMCGYFAAKTALRRL